MNGCVLLEHTEEVLITGIKARKKDLAIELAIERAQPELPDLLQMRRPRLKGKERGGINLLFARISDAANSSRRSQQYKQ